MNQILKAQLILVPTLAAMTVGAMWLDWPWVVAAGLLFMTCVLNGCRE